MINTKKLTVLYVEDSMTMRKATMKMLSNFFDHVDEAKDGLEAFNLYRDKHENNDKFYDIVFSDLEMPNLDGHELSKRVLELNSDQEIVIISGVNDYKRLVDLINTGIKHFISKPMEEDQLERVINSVVNNIRQKKLRYEDNKELEEHNAILRKREEGHKKLLEAKMKELEEFNNALDESAIVSKSDPNGIITYVNERFCKICGYSKEELIGQNNSIVKSGTRSKSFYQKLWNKISNKETYKTIFENRRKDGSIYWIESTISPIVNMNGDLVEFIAVAHDMTKLMQSLESTKQAEKSKEDFFINISHEMRTPLNSILGFSSILEKRLKDDEKSLLMAQKISETGNDLTSIVESILDLRKIKEQTLELKDVVFNPRTELDRCFAKYEEKAAVKNIEFNRIIEHYLPENLLGDTVRVTQVIGIVIDNAVKFTPNGGKVHVNISYDEFDKILICEVKDNGIGIEKENQSKIFRLEQLDGSRTREYEGAGFGLNIASNLIKIMKGTISLKSIPDKGSMFTIEFPLAHA